MIANLISRFFPLISMAINFALACLFFVIIGKLDVFISNPIIATVCIGYYVGVALIAWGVPTIWGWIVGIVVTVWIVLIAINFFGAFFEKAKGAIKRFR